MTERHKAVSAEDYAARAHAIQDKLYRMAYCYVKNEHDALEIVSNAVYKGYLSHEKLQNAALLDTWLTRIVINCALDFCRARGKTAPIDDAIAYLPAPESGAALEEKLDLYAALDMLPPDEKSLVMLKYFEELRFSDIAELLAISENTVKTRLYRALARLREHYNLWEGQNHE